jgi:hypothetical protein
VAREWGRIPAARDSGGQIVRLDGADDRQWIRLTSKVEHNLRKNKNDIKNYLYIVKNTM